MAHTYKLALEMCKSCIKHIKIYINTQKKTQKTQDITLKGLAEISESEIAYRENVTTAKGPALS